MIFLITAGYIIRILTFEFYMFLSHHRLMDNRGFRRIHHVAGAVSPQILFCSLFCKRDTIVLFKLNFTFLSISIAIIIVIIIILQNKLTYLGVPFFIIFTTAKIKHGFGFHCVASFVSLLLIIICRRLHKRQHTFYCGDFAECISE